MIHLYDRTITIKRLTTTSGDVRAYVSTGTADASIQPLGKDRGQLDEGLFGATYVAYVEDGTDIVEGDKIVDDTGRQFVVSQVVVRDEGAFPYTEVILKKK